VSYQIPGTPGDILLNEHKYTYNNGDQEEVKCDVLKFDFSSHSGRSQLIDFAKKTQFVDSEKRVFAVHGEEEVAESFVQELIKEGFNAVAPKQGESFKI
jgi:metallo-beta-lactamase family protein